MAQDQQKQSTEAIVNRFKKGALLDDEGYVYSEPDLSVEGLNLIRQSLKELDAIGPRGRDVLVPLLDDPAAAIRVYAAAALVKTIPDRALAVLHEIRDRSLSDAHMTASRLLILYETGDLDASLEPTPTTQTNSGT